MPRERPLLHFTQLSDLKLGAAVTGASSLPWGLMRVLVTGKCLHSLSVRHASATGRIALNFGHTTAWPWLRPSGQKDRWETCLRVTVGIPFLHESGIQVPGWAWFLALWGPNNCWG